MVHDLEGIYIHLPQTHIISRDSLVHISHVHMLLFALAVSVSIASDFTISVDPHSKSFSLESGVLTTVPTLAAAQDALRAVLVERNFDVNIFVNLSAGLHRVPRGGLVLTKLDSPAPGRVVTWTGLGNTIVSGGENVTGWVKAADPSLPAAVFKAPVPAVLRNSSSRQLYVNGQRAARTSRPARDALAGLTLETRTDCPACSYAVESTEPLHWSNPSDVEFVYSAVGSGWSESRCTVLDIQADPNATLPNCTLATGAEADCGFPFSNEAQCIANRTAAHPNGCCWHPGGAAPSGHWCVVPVYPGVVSPTRITMRQPCLWNLVNRPFQPIGGAPPTTVENVREHLTEPGQWYLDRTRQEILYFPLPDQDMDTVSAVIAVEENLVSFDGAARQSWNNVTFAFATWLRPGQGEGFVEQQSAACNTCPYGVTQAWNCGKDDVYAVTPGNVALTGALAVDFANCSFVHLGAYAASARGGSQFVSFRGCHFSDVSGGAVMMGDTASFNITDVSKWDANFTVSDCTAINIPVEFTGATTIFSAYVADTTIEHNLIVNASYSAMTLGWGWGREAALRGGNKIVANRIEGAQTIRCCDGGGLYTLGPQPGSALLNNYIVEGPPHAWGPAAGNAIYHDNGSGGFTDSGNVIDGTWGTYLVINESDGPYGPGLRCPGLDGQPSNCGMEFTGNWMRTAAGGAAQHRNSTIAGNTKLAPGAALPPAAAAIASSSGPRY